MGESMKKTNKLFTLIFLKTRTNAPTPTPMLTHLTPSTGTHKLKHTLTHLAQTLAKTYTHLAHTHAPRRFVTHSHARTHTLSGNTSNEAWIQLEFASWHSKARKKNYAYNEMAAVAAAKGGMIKLKTAKAIYLRRDALKIINTYTHNPPPPNIKYLLLS